MSTHFKGYVLDSAATGTHTITVGDQGATNVKNIAIQLKKGSGADVDAVSVVNAYMSDDAAGNAIAAVAADGNVAIGTDGSCIHVVTDKIFILSSESDGDIDLDIEMSTADTWYLVVINSNGTRQISDAITFDAA